MLFPAVMGLKLGRGRRTGQARLKQEGAARGGVSNYMEGLK